VVQESPKYVEHRTPTARSYNRSPIADIDEEAIKRLLYPLRQSAFFATMISTRTATTTPIRLPEIKPPRKLLIRYPRAYRAKMAPLDSQVVCSRRILNAKLLEKTLRG